MRPRDILPGIVHPRKIPGPKLTNGAWNGGGGGRATGWLSSDVAPSLEVVVAVKFEGMPPGTEPSTTAENLACPPSSVVVTTSARNVSPSTLPGRWFANSSTMKRERALPNPHPGAGWLPVHPVHRDVALDARYQLVRDDPQSGFAHDLPCALVLGERVIERNFFIREARFLAARSCRLDVLGKLDQFFDDLRGREGVGVITGNSCFEPFRERLRLGHVALG